MRSMTISDTSPLFYLYRLGLLEVLKDLYGTVTVPNAVRKELEIGGEQGEDIPHLENYPWIEIATVSMPEYLKLISDLGSGESEVLALAMKHPSPRVILDDKLARRIAAVQGFQITGTAGILLKAKQKRIIKTLKPIIEQLLTLGFYLKPELVNAILMIAGEK